MKIHESKCFVIVALTRRFELRCHVFSTNLTCPSAVDSDDPPKDLKTITDDELVTEMTLLFKQASPPGLPFG